MWLVNSFMKYKSQLNSKCGRLFQRSSAKFDRQILLWYDNVPLGHHNSIEEMMPIISRKAGILLRYTNHSLRATSVHILDSTGNFANIHVMTVTGHKYETSLKS